jgi:hypothetical protein
LYAKDTGEMGSSAGTPLDKYDSKAASLIVKLKKAATREDVQTVLRVFPGGQGHTDREGPCRMAAIPCFHS